MPSYLYNGDGDAIVCEDDGTERPATPREIADKFQGVRERKDANQTGFDVVRRATEGR